MELETTTTRNGGHQLETALNAGFDGDGHALLSCAGCGLLMSRAVAANSFWVKQPCDGLGAKVVMTGSDSAEHYATIDMLPHDWNRGSGDSADAQPYTLFGDDAAAPTSTATVAGTLPLPEARATIRSMLGSINGASSDLKWSLRCLRSRKYPPSTEDVARAKAAARTEIEVKAVDTLAAHWAGS